jgi:hypothetical protein
MAIVQRCEEVYGYTMFHHQRVIVEHIKDGRQHFHVMWNRVSVMTGKAVYPGLHWKKSKEVAREMEIKLGLKRTATRRKKSTRVRKASGTDTKNTANSSAGTTRRTITYKPIIQPKIPTTKTAKERKQNPSPFRPVEQKKVWPEAAIIDWEAWGHLFPRRFFIKWPELANH